MPKPRRLLRGEITYSAAQEDETNILHKLDYWDQRAKFFHNLYENRSLIQTVVAHHLGLYSTETCRIAEQDQWVHGSFNLCIPVTIEDSKSCVEGKTKARFEGKPEKSPWYKRCNDYIGSPLFFNLLGKKPYYRHCHFHSKRVIIRFPLPYRVGEAFRQGNADEKLRCEAGTYIWLQEDCPTVPIPYLYGFMLSTGQTFTALENLPFIARHLQYLRRQALQWLRYPVPSRYVRHQRGSPDLGTGYLLIEYIEETHGKMLSETWSEKRNDAQMRSNLFRDLSRILLTITRVSFPRIGSFTIDDDGFLSLSNRPLSLEIQNLENESIPVEIPRDFTYSTVDSYITDTLDFHDSRLSHQPNAVNDGQDCIYQMSALMIMRAVASQFFRRDLRRGPFIFALTDMHTSNILVDEDWHIKCVIDLEWAHTRPVEMQHPPHWLTEQAVDRIDADEYDKIRKEFMDIFRQEEEISCCETPVAVRLSSVMEQGWEMGTFWFSLALSSPTGLFKLFYNHIQPRLKKGHGDDAAFFSVAMYYWKVNAWDFIVAKMKDKSDYDARLRKAFED